MNDSTLDQDTTAKLKQGGGWVVALGVLMIILGMMAIGSPFMMTAVTVIWIGAALLVSGIFELVGVFRANGWQAGLLAFLGGALSIMAGGYLLSNPLRGSAILAFVLTAYLVIDGIGKLILAFQLKPLKGWGWTLSSGVATLLLSILIWKHWPLSALWVIGTLVGINILFKGFAMVALGAATRQVASEAAAA